MKLRQRLHMSYGKQYVAGLRRYTETQEDPLRRYTETQEDPLVNPIDKKVNPWAEKSKCSVL
ncbi:unnamed protein product [Cylicostephanus goldi]|uniref:G protein gamma domain-containing protein n=1 Tax=Cylicostephanus goldi TaxID=71465 RepID=A0A3P7NCA1_CYLGO|nr:unnamed protein product [Cylicostephanus goldi]